MLVEVLESGEPALTVVNPMRFLQLKTTAKREAVMKVQNLYYVRELERRQGCFERQAY